MYRCPHCGNDLGAFRASVEHKLNVIIEQGIKIMSAQDNVNADVAALSSFLGDIENAVVAIKAELDEQGVTVDTSALDALVGQLPTVQASVDALVTPPAAPVAPVDGGTPVDGS